MTKHKCPFPDCDYETADVGDELAAVLISVHVKGAHTSPPVHGAPSPSNQTAKIKKVRAGTSEEWSYFMTRWGYYVEATKVQGKDKVIQLLQCCDEQLRKDLTCTAGGSSTNKTTEDILKAIKKLAVREENAMVARVQLHNMRQDRDETIRSFGELWSGNISDRNITQKSGIIDKLEPKDEVMADRGFNIKDLVTQKKATLNIPPFSKRKALSSKACTQTRRIVAVRIHVERAIQRMKNFRILHGVLPITLAPVANQTVFVCAALCNLLKPLVKK